MVERSHRYDKIFNKPYLIRVSWGQVKLQMASAEKNVESKLADHDKTAEEFNCNSDLRSCD